MSIPHPTTSRLLAGYLGGMALSLVAYWFMPTSGWLHAFWQSVAGWTSAAFIVIGVRRHRPEGARAWYFIAAGTALNASGVVVEMIAWRGFGVTDNPNVADAFWSALYPGLIAGLGILVYRRIATEDFGTMLLNTTVCVLLNLFVGVLSWQFVVWRTQNDPSLTLANRMIVTAYPLADMMILALMVRLLLSGGLRNVSVRLMLGWFACIVPSDIGWSSFLRSGAMPERVVQYFMEATSMIANTLLAAAALHPDVRAIAPAAEGRVPPLGFLGWLGLFATALTAPAVVALQAILDLLYSVSSL